MLKDLTYSVTFPTNGLSLQGQLSPPPGITAITGENGSGKTFGSIEMFRYMLFGKKALRGPASDYKSLEGTLDVEIKGTSFRVVRNRKEEKLFDAQDTVLAVGAEAVTQRIVKELGFGLEVFDVACASVQKETDKLSKLRPAERKRLIDEVVGLTSNEAVEKACRDEAKGFRREAEALRETLAPIDEPTRPTGYRPSADLHAELSEIKARLHRQAELQKLVSAVGPEPVPPVRNIPNISDIENHERTRLEIDARRAQLIKAISAIPDAEWSTEQLDLAETRLQYLSEVRRRGPKPSRSLDDVNRDIEAWAHYGALKSIGSVEVDCPSCGHHFAPGTELPTPPEMSLSDLREEQRRHAAWELPLPEAGENGPELTADQIKAGRLALDRADERAEMERELLVLENRPDRSDELRQARQIQAEHDAYARAAVEYANRAQAASDAQAELDVMGAVVDNSAELDAAYVAARIYESQVETYEKAKAVHDELVATIAEKGRKAEAYKAGAEALASTRAQVKAHLAPSMSKVASSLISQMTGGSLQNVMVDEEMNITVDGQEIGTLSGAGSTVANLALRLALGQVLVRNALPIFFADEADADMSAARAQFTMECLSNLRDRLQQIIIISHKNIENVDHLISLPGK